MSNAQHTPGPWSLNEKAAHPWVVECPSDIPGHPGTVCEVSYRPNARLIAAAPELLEALEFVIRGVPDTWDGVQKARAAIAKAKEGAK